MSSFLFSAPVPNVCGFLLNSELWSTRVLSKIVSNVRHTGNTSISGKRVNYTLFTDINEKFVDNEKHNKKSRLRQPLLPKNFKTSIFSKIHHVCARMCVFVCARVNTDSDSYGGQDHRLCMASKDAVTGFTI